MSCWWKHKGNGAAEDEIGDINWISVYISTNENIYLMNFIEIK